ncbi:hypothetical protein MMC13_003190 [Lambiella insularis]|nr:hypothetical protein [Lambiella insularis]
MSTRAMVPDSDNCDAHSNLPSQAVLQAYTHEEWVSTVDQTVRKLPKAYKTFSHPRHKTARYIDHTLLKLDATEDQIDRLCDEAKEYSFKADHAKQYHFHQSVCVRLNHVTRAVQTLRDSSVVVACVVGFHEGHYSTSEKLDEASAAVKHGAAELDIVLNHTLLPPRTSTPDYPTIYRELLTLRTTTPPPTILKLILETSQLSPSAIQAACVLAAHAGFDFVKTSTGFNGPGATVEDVRMMKAVVEVVSGEKVQVKASGGVRTLADCERMFAAGATRIGSSSGVTIMREERGSETMPDVESMECY